MKNTGIIILCCIFAVILLPIINIKQINLPQDINLISVYNTMNTQVTEMNIEDYVLKVLEKEMPPSYDNEALKAQAIAIRTYALRKKGSDISEHFGADVCTDYKHCMAYSYDEKEQWGERTDEYVNIYKRAVKETEGMILTYEGKPAATFFFAISGGNTQNSSNVWGSDIPYLKSVNSDVDKNRSGYKSEVKFTSKELSEKLGVTFNDDYEIKYFDSGYVEYLKMNGKTIKGEEVRAMLQLRSSCFDISNNGEFYVFKVYGYGHGVGMSQQGADEMAKQGKTYIDILNHYYKGTKLSKI